jgi:hypothetical protein
MREVFVFEYVLDKNLSWFSKIRFQFLGKHEKKTCIKQEKQSVLFPEKLGL